MQKAYATVIMRCQPPHLAHLEIIDRIYEDGYEPLILLGSANSQDASRNPYDYKQRDEMLQRIYPEILTEPLNDYDDWDKWLNEVLNYMDVYDSKVFYTFNKKEDMYESFSVLGKDYKNAYFSDAINDAGRAIINITNTSYPELHARDIRGHVEDMRLSLHPTTYNYIKGHP